LVTKLSYNYELAGTVRIRNKQEASQIMTQENLKQYKDHYYWIDLLRFVSALLVVICHYRGSFFIEYGLLSNEDKNIFTQIFFFIARLGNEPVLVFFVLSGFLVGGRSMQRILNNDIDLKLYFIDRFTRIILPLLDSLFFIIVIYTIIENPIPVKDIIGSLFSLQGVVTSTAFNPPLWSLAYEVWFYTLIGCLMVICRNKNNKKVMCAFFVLAICIYFFSILNTMYLLILFMGTFAFLLKRENTKHLKSKIIILLILLGGAFVLSQLSSESRSLNLSSLGFLNKKATDFFLAFVTALLVHHLIIVKPQKKIWINIESISSKFAAFSYTLYLTHYPLMHLLTYFGFPKSKQINTTAICFYLIGILISLIVAYLICLVSEKQISIIKKYINKRLLKQQ
jgi:peptidoglycan/LPS O-acetylase OafA/YrhL